MAAAKGKTNWFAIGVSIAVVVVLVGLGGIVVWLNNQATAPSPTPEAAIVNAETGAIGFGEGETTVSVFVDFICPACGSFEDRYGADLQAAAANDELRLEYHPIAILDYASQGTDYSSRAAGAMYCVAESAPEAALDFLNTLFANQPAEGSPGLSNDELAAYAEQVGAGAAVSCIQDGTYKRYGREQAAAHQITGTPTVEIDGERLTRENMTARMAELLG